MAVFSALRWALGALLRNPVVFLATGIIGALQVPQLAAQAIDPAIATATSMVFSLGFVVVMPYIQGGLIAMADEALDGQTSLRTFTRAGRANYVQLLIGYALLLGVNLVLVLLIGVVGLVGGIALFVLVPNPEAVGMLALAVVVVLLLVLVLAYLVVVFVVQFYGQAIVIDDDEAIEGLRRSIRVVRSNLVATTGYSVVAGIVGGLFGVAIGIASILLSAGTGTTPDLVQLSLAAKAAILVGVVASSMLVGALLLTYSVGFYRTVRT